MDWLLHRKMARSYGDHIDFPGARLARERPLSQPPDHFNAGSPMFIFFQPCNSTWALGSWPLAR